MDHAVQCSTEVKGGLARHLRCQRMAGSVHGSIAHSSTDCVITLHTVRQIKQRECWKGHTQRPHTHFTLVFITSSMESSAFDFDVANPTPLTQALNNEHVDYTQRLEWGHFKFDRIHEYCMQHRLGGGASHAAVGACAIRIGVEPPLF